jgi:hypothetical protein
LAGPIKEEGIVIRRTAVLASFVVLAASAVIGGTAEVELGDWNVDNYHGVITYNFGDGGSKARPYVFGGAGVTHYSSFKSDAAGWWCDPYWGCYVVGNAQYSNQFEFTGGLTFKF